jgi:cell wall-associated NlpC family hydrolase
MTRPTPAQLAFARSNLPVRRVASTPANPTKSPFAAMLQKSTQRRAASSIPSDAGATTYHTTMLAVGAPSKIVAGGPAPISRSEILNNAQPLIGIPYVWGGDNASGLDCSSFLSKAWGIGRHTTDNLSSVATPVSKDELQAGDALNLTTGRDPQGYGHVRLFDRWSNAEHTKMYVYEETPPKSIHRIINWDPNYQPMRRMNVTGA